MKQRTYGYEIVKMAENMTVEELVALQDSLTSDPHNRTDAKHWGGNTPTVWLYNKKTMRKLDAISWAIYHIQKAEAKKRSEESDSVAQKT